MAWGAVKKKGSYFKDKYYRLKARRGAKKAITAIAHRILLGVYHVIKDGAEFRDLGEEYLTRRSKSQKVFHLRKQVKLRFLSPASYERWFYEERLAA